MTRRFPAGSEWRKWDLHVHVPGTKRSDNYEPKDGKPDWDRFADAIEQSDVAVVGITDYFSADQSMGFIDHFKAKYPESEKLLLVNVELRLNETVNGNTQLVNFHIIFRDSIPAAKVQEFLSRLKTQTTDPDGRHKTCAELVGGEFATATVTRDDIKRAFADTFGDKAELSEKVLYLAPANNDGLRAQRGSRRKAYLADEIDKDVHAIFGKDPDNSIYYLKTDRFEDQSQISKPKPVFGGCDARSFKELDDWLGKSDVSESTRQVITWVKADPTWEGLQQTLVEPGDRVALSDLMPDAKDQYKFIRRVTFSGSKDFPDEIAFNPNLNAIIGSRSSGKSALLAHIAHAVDPAYAVQQQMLASKANSESEVGPAAGLSWRDVANTICRVEWADGSVDGGNVIYIPQNWLYQISDNPRVVTGKIQPVLVKHYPHYFREHTRLLDVVKTANLTIEKATTRWFELAAEHGRLTDEIKQVGDRKAITKARDEIKDQIETLRDASALSADDLNRYQEVVHTIEADQARIAEIDIEAEQLSEYVSEGPRRKVRIVAGAVSAETYLTPDVEDVPERLAAILSTLISEAEVALVAKAEAAIVTYREALAAEAQSLTKAVKKLQTDNKELIAKHKANATLDELVKRQKAQQDSLDRIDKLEARRVGAAKNERTAAEQIARQVLARSDAVAALKVAFEAEPRVLDQLTFGISIELDDETVRDLSEPFRKNETGTFLLKRSEESDALVDIEKAQSDPAAFMQDLFTRKQRLNVGNAPVDVAGRVLTATPEVRFTAELDSDRIGGFDKSTMTPGKRALFALTLILGEAEELWTLLIDQPEDDLDSRSIYGDIVRYLVQQKKQRQIILVTHNANLVVGADAEEVLVANRHGDDRKNRDSRTFDYLTGSLEHSAPRKSAAYDLDRMGIREHAVEILDGGEEAFRKRRDKYKL